jgi:hypothetical protein
MFYVSQVVTDRFDVMQQGGINDQYPGATVVQVVFIVLGTVQGIQADGNGTHLYCPEKCLGKDFRIQKQQRYPLLHAYIHGYKGVSEAVYPLLNLAVGDGPILAQDSDLVTQPLADVSVHEVVGGVECFRQIEIVRHGFRPPVFSSQLTSGSS